MAITKKIKLDKISEVIIFIFLSIFPLGQFIKINVELLGVDLRFQPIDLIIFPSLILDLIGLFKSDCIFKKFRGFLIISLFSLFLSFTYFNINYIFAGFLYFLRLCSYGTFYLLINNYLKANKNKNNLLINSLLLTFVFISIFGWIQYFWYADIRFLKYLQWDDHYFRLVGSFLDPAYTAILMVIASIIAFYRYKRTNHIIFLISLMLFSLTLAFTYSRAGFLSFIISLTYILIKLQKLKIILFVFMASLVIIVLLPRPSSEGVKLERLHSITLKIQNYKDTFKIYEKYPLFGVGYNNICAAKIKRFGQSYNFESHSCSGSDSSLLLILATTGIIGFMIFLDFLIALYREFDKDMESIFIKAILLSVFINSFFVNSLFYPWVMGCIAITVAYFQSIRENISD